MTRRQFFMSAGAAAVKAKRPNILLLMPDQLRAQALGCMGDPNVRSPNIDRLAAEGALLRNTFANTPVCCPARANILTGRHAHRNGMVANDLRLRESEVTISQVLRDAGYSTGFIGKWHLDGGPRLPGFVPPGARRHGFDFWAANECSHTHFDTQYFRDTSDPQPIKKFEAEAWTDLALEFLREKRTQPFFLTVQFGPPHDPYRAPAEYSKLYDAAKLSLRANFKDGAVTRRDIAEYYAMITAVDEQVGRILRELDALSLVSDTIVLLTSDHGDMLGSQGARLKRKPWEESIHVPGILRYPRAISAGARDVFFTHVDFAPTLLGLCGVAAPRRMQGLDISRSLVQRGGGGPGEAFLQIFGPYQGDGTEAGWRGVRTARYTYARYREQPWLLYDNERDPDQTQNLVNDAALVERLERRLRRWMRATGDDWSTNWTAPVEDGGRLYRDRAYHTVDEYLKAHGGAG